MRWTIKKVIEDYVECIRTGRWHENRHLTTVWFDEDGALFSKVSYDCKIIAIPVPSVDGKPTVIVDRSIYKGRSLAGNELRRFFTNEGARLLGPITTKVESMAGLTVNPVLWAASFDYFTVNMMDRLIRRYQNVQGIPTSPEEWHSAVRVVRKARKMDRLINKMQACHDIACGEMDKVGCLRIIEDIPAINTLLDKAISNAQYLEKQVNRFADDSLLAMPDEVLSVLDRLREIVANKDKWIRRVNDAYEAALDYIDKHPSGPLFFGKMLSGRRFRKMVFDRAVLPDVCGLILPLLLQYGSYGMVERVLRGEALDPAALLKFAQVLKGELRGERKQMRLPALRVATDADGKASLVVQQGVAVITSVDPTLITLVLEMLTGGNGQ